jgi:hypothetical protein
MAVSTTTFAERLKRAEKSDFVLYAGNDAPQVYKPSGLISFAGTGGKTAWSSVLLGGLVGGYVGYLFKANVNIELFFTQPPLVVFEILKADIKIAAICIAMLAGVILALGAQVLSYSRSRISQFSWSYVLAAAGVNVSTWLAYFQT